MRIGHANAVHASGLERHNTSIDLENLCTHSASSHRRRQQISFQASRLVGKNLQSNLCRAGVNHPYCFGRSIREINNPVLYKRSPVIDANLYLFAVFKVADPYYGVEGKGAMCRGEGGFIVLLAAGGATPVMAISIPGSDSNDFGLGRHWYPDSFILSRAAGKQRDQKGHCKEPGP